MAKFSQELSGIIMLYNKIGSHLNSKEEGTNAEQEKKNFMHTQQMLAEMRSGMTTNGHAVMAEYVNEKTEEQILKKSLEWENNHIRES